MAWNPADFDKTRWVVRNYNAVYVAKHGDDRNDGHPRRPAASLNRGVQLALSYGFGTVLLGSGVYSESAPLNWLTTQGDGFVTLDGAGAGSLSTNGGAGGTIVLVGLRVQNYNCIFYDGNVGTQNVVFKNLNYIVPAGDVGSSQNFFKTLFVDAPLLSPTQPGPYTLSTSFEQCTLINANFSNSLFAQGSSAQFLFRNSYADARSQVGGSYQPRPDRRVDYTFQNSNVEGFVCGQRLADYVAAGHVAVDCISAAPGFNNPQAQDYTLTTTSTMRNLAFDGGYAGAYGIGINFTGLPDADVVTNCQWNSTLGAFILTDQTRQGSVEFVVKDFMRNWILEESLLVGEEDNIDNQTIDATLSYDVDSFGAPANVQSGALESGRTYWNNGYDMITYKGQNYLQGQFFACTDDLTYVALGTGKVVRLLEAPNIRLYEMKYSSLSAVDCVSRPWKYFVYGKVPTLDAAGRSNGDPLFDPASANPITVRYMKLRLTLMPNSLA